MPAAALAAASEQGELSSWGLDKRSRTETLDAVYTCDLLIQITYLLC